MNDEDFESFLKQAQDELEAKQAVLQEEYGLGQHHRFVIEYEASRITSFDQERPRVEAVILPVATHVEASNSLKWSWANPKLPQPIRDDAARVKNLFEITGFEMFANETVQCDSSMAWEVTALACKCMAALGAYRVPHRGLNAYVLITQIKSIP